MKYALKTASKNIVSAIDYKKELNPEQFRVVSEAEGPCLVLAGAGSGKTRTLIYRVAYLLERGVRPEEILLVTFTNKAAAQMRDRVEMLLETKAKGLWCGTFHHIGNRILRIHSKAIGLSDGFGILDDEDSRDLVKSCIKSLNVGTSEARFPKAGVVQAILSFAANSRQTVPAVVSKHYAYLAQFTKDFERVRVLYEEKKRKTSNLDYDDLLIRWIELLQKSPEVRERLTRQFRYCLVDEYQDTNRLQNELMGILSSHHKNLLVVGDDAQSIYSFRAAEIKNILDFPERHEHSQIFKLQTNYRSTTPILELANASILNNTHQFPKTLHSVRENKKAPLPQLVKVRDTRQEAAFIAQRVLEFKQLDIALDRIAVLFRARYQAAELELELAKRGIPYVIRGGVRFFEQAHVKDVLSYLRLLANPADELAWTRALTLQPGIGGGYAEKIFETVQKETGGLEKASSPAFGEALPAKVREGLSGFKRILKNLLKEGVSGSPDRLLEEILNHGYQKHVLLNFENARDRLEDLRELVNFAHTYKNLKEFLADVTLREGFKGESIAEGGAENDREETALILSTIHQAKGLEWRAVFVLGLAEGLFPHAKSMEDEEELEEERRLFYVAVTRAQDSLILTHAMTRYDYSAGMVISRPSCFLKELPSDAYQEVEVEENQEEETIYLD